MKRWISKSMKRITRTLIVASLLVATSQSAFAALTVKTTGGSGYGIFQTGSGGEFTLQQGEDLNVVGNYSLYTKNQGNTSNTFQSFCLEYNEHIYTNTTYSAIINNAAVNGGTNNGSDPISNGTAWLYKNFAAGTLAGYNYGAGRSTSAFALQNAIWYLEGERTLIDLGLTNASQNTFLNQVIQQYTSIDIAKQNNATVSGVAVLNLYEYGHAGEQCYKRQDQLVATPTPIPAAAWLFGSGILGLVGIKRRKNS